MIDRTKKYFYYRKNSVIIQEKFLKEEVNGMASFVIHHIAGEHFLSILKEKYQLELSPEQEKRFLLGNLIVDSSRITADIPKNLTKEELKELKQVIRDRKQKEKIETHFRSELDVDYCIQAPQIAKFLSYYENLSKTDFSALGYLFHLYTDKMFFDNLFAETFECLDIYGKPTIYIKDTTYMRVKKNEVIYNIKDFWDNTSTFSIYQDYTVMNKILLEYYGTTFLEEEFLNFISFFINPGIKEVDYQNITDVIHKTSSFFQESYQVNNTHLNIFDTNQVKQFIEKVAINFVADYGFILENIIAMKKSQNILQRKKQPLKEGKQC